MSRVAFKQCDIERLLRAARAAGIDAPTVEVRPDGAIRLLTGAQALSPSVVPADDIEAELEAFARRHGYA